MQFFAVQVIVAAAWTTPFSISENFISDLAAVHCGIYPAQGGHYVCSPWHALMNTSMLLQGAFIAVGAITWRVRKSPAYDMSLKVLLILSAVGSCLVAALPEDQAPGMHYAAAALHIVCGNLALLLLPATLARRSGIARIVAVSGLAGLIATALLPTGQYLGLGAGGLERIAVYPLPLCLSLIGLQVLREKVSSAA